ncbi:MAG: methyltransferase domain-containing protein [Bacteroidetes bacterium]|nr:methyltransferase domain-containing protein [Bacteroidota bacterium]
MKKVAKRLLLQMHIYHPLQSFYRGSINFSKKKYYQFTYSKYKGKGFICNYCKASYEKFVPEYPSQPIEESLNINEVIAGYGANVYCPNCMSKNRERLLLAVIQNRVQFKKKSILHFSPEKHLYDFLNTQAIVSPVDILPGFYQSIDRSTAYADATNLLFKDESFEIVIANHIMEHIPEDIQAMKEIHRVLKPGGLAILQVPYSEKLKKTIEDPFINNPIEQEKLYGQKDHVRIYALNDYLSRLKTAGFKIEVLANPELEVYKIYAIQENEKVFICHKEK